METQSRTKMRTCLFRDRASADAAYDAALRRGYKPEDVNIIMAEDTRNKYYPADARDTTTTTTTAGDQALDGLAMGSAIGGTVLGTIALILSMTSTIVIPGLGLVIAGPLAAGLTGFGAGSITGGILGLLIGAGIPEERAKVYEKGLKEGGIIVAVKSRSPSEDELLIEDWKKHNGTEIY